MGLVRWMTRNVCDSEKATHSDIRGIQLSVSPEEAVQGIVDLVSRKWLWRVDRIEGNVVHATRRTPVFRFVDDICIKVYAETGGCVVHARSQSRIGKGDLGQNRRNVLELFRMLRKRWVAK
jgi:uncharacterized protein (DUF1499 family)